MLCVGAALVPLALAVLFYWHDSAFIEHSILTRGVVVSLHRNRGHLNTGMNEFPVFTFRDGAGRRHTVDSDFGSYPPAYSVGEKVPVRYNAAHPDDALIASPFILWLGTLIAGAIAVAFLSCGIILIFLLSPVLVYIARKYSLPDTAPIGHGPYTSMGYRPPPQ